MENNDNYDIEIKEIDGQRIEDEGEISLDIYKNVNELIIIAPLSGVKKEDLNIRINDNVLVIIGKREKPLENYDKTLVSECFWGKFSRIILLPQKSDTSNIKAKFENGILNIKIPILFTPKEKIIDIN